MSEADQAAWKKIVPVQQICVGDNYTRWRRMKEKGPVPTMYAAEFWAKYGGDPVQDLTNRGACIRPTRIEFNSLGFDGPAAHCVGRPR